jgi:hypothetical protein
VEVDATVASSGGGCDVTVRTFWDTIASWERWSSSETCRRLHLPSGVYQRVPNKGEGFPEDFLPFRDYDAPVNPKY